ncbi:Holin of 3TMs, for gene-transfer release [Humidesulfovibrio mexicanus]|uniref:Holin of 3TMs, for gene-transfer release n=1 Tax=Humidesulfovibrio mexicanus TaxID=147047 RepID=A0A239AWG2_9BACT|nr:3TM-type holin [Humidesulfovibrio mexicanus]SNR99308.1 Holin of 3TMs, for gene-transfer release [Humidesulfovibrio mexicanus]
MDPITIIGGLIGVAPTIAKWIGGDKAEEVANTVASVAQAVTGKADAQSAVDAIKADPALAMEFQKAWLATELALEQEETKRQLAVNETMRAEAHSEHWPQWSWRPFWGFTSALAFLFVSILCCWLGFDAVKSKNMAALNMIPQLVASFGLLFGTPLAILGVASFKRGQEKIEKLKTGAQ